MSDSTDGCSEYPAIADSWRQNSEHVIRNVLRTAQEGLDEMRIEKPHMSNEPSKQTRPVMSARARFDSDHLRIEALNKRRQLLPPCTSRHDLPIRAYEETALGRSPTSALLLPIEPKKGCGAEAPIHNAKAKDS
jgi:hypothetical protein